MGEAAIAARAAAKARSEKLGPDKQKRDGVSKGVVSTFALGSAAALAATLVYQGGDSSVEYTGDVDALRQLAQVGRDSTTKFVAVVDFLPKPALDLSTFSEPSSEPKDAVKPSPSSPKKETSSKKALNGKEITISKLEAKLISTPPSASAPAPVVASAAPKTTAPKTAPNRDAAAVPSSNLMPREELKSILTNDVTGVVDSTPPDLVSPVQDATPTVAAPASPKKAEPKKPEPKKISSGGREGPQEDFCGDD